jgi:DNA segregation ATPase FtsK/SpoIIIE, S-DNA-T family
MAGGQSVGKIEQEIEDAYVRLAESVAVVRYCHKHYLDGLIAAVQDPAPQAGREIDARRADAEPEFTAETAPTWAALGRTARLFNTVKTLTSANPWALGGFGDPVWDDYRPDVDASAPDGLRVGVLKLPGGEGLPPIPAVARFVGHGHLLITENESPDRARSLLQALALRLAAASSPRTVRFALADPVGQGQHLSAFLRLPAPLLRMGSRVAATETEVEALLETLTGHVVEVTQNRLTNVYDSIEAYNAATTGVAVPYHILVLAGFPAGITDRGAELLAKLAKNGPRAGVYIIATVDPGCKMPRGFDLAALTRLAALLKVGSDGTVTWDDPEFRESVIEPDKMPTASLANPWLNAVAVAAESVSHDLSFDQIAVPEDRRWGGHSTDGLDAQIGVDSKGEPQLFVIGASGIHHGLVGGDVRMGKTNLLHVLITQLALRYPPEELELYLLDFKEVEFDAYLTEHLPHARAITSRTDREFGLSMLRRFHEEIDRRARLCREAQVTNLPDYRRETGRVLSRAVVVMDEFQVLFAEEDRLSREAGRLLADIAKRGAAFGLHLLLTTQSPGGSLAVFLRPVYEQMALRIALGCKLPSVSQAILGEGNDAATKLNRAGEAIYNDRRGEGANPVIRIALLPNKNRREWMTAIRTLAGGRSYPRPASFDPDAPADFSAHPACAAFAASPGHWGDPGPTVVAWLGEAIEIKPATAATFERYLRSNLLVVGGEEHGYGLLLATLLSVAIQRSPADVSFTIAQFARPSSPYHGFFTAVRGLPHDVRIAGPRKASATLEDLIADLDARLADAGNTPRPERFFLIAGLRGWQELLTEDRYGKPSETSEMLVRLADKGPDVGIHVVAWAHSYGSAERALRRTGIGYFGLRAVLRVSSTAESDSLLGTPAAASLEDNRALYRDDTDWTYEQVEKFKPYSNASLHAFAGTAFGSLA